MIRPAQLFRLLHISYVLVKHGLDDILFATHLFRPVHLLRYLSPFRLFRDANVSRGARIRHALEELGPIFVKAGQILSTRQDLVPEDIVLELSRLQDQVPPFPGNEARAIIEQALDATIASTFAEFETMPLASASIAQVHAARLDDGTEVVVKVLRPGIDKQVQRDVALLRYIATLAQRYWKDGRRLRPVEVVDEIDNTLQDEQDLLREAANASQLRRNFDNSPMLYVPEVYWPLCRRNVMVMERIHGIQISDIDALRENGIDLEKLSARGVEIFFTQVFRHNFFHADMHPGNIFVGADGLYKAVDFGIMGTLSPEDQRYLAENFLAFFQRDYQRVAELHVESEWVPRGTRVDEFESAIRSVCEPIFERPLKEISFGQLLLRLFQTARRFDMEVQPQLVLLQKTLLNIEGLGRQLYPDLDLWQTAKPFLEQWMHDQVGGKAFLKQLRTNFPKWSETLPELPQLMHRVLSQAAEGRLQLEWTSSDLKQIRQEMRRNGHRNANAIIGTGLVISSAIVYGLDGHAPALFGGAPLFTWILGIGGVLFLWRAADSGAD